MAKRKLRSVPKIPEPRTAEQINQEYGNICALLGQAEHRIRIIKKQQDEFSVKLATLDLEMDRSRVYYQKKQEAQTANQVVQQ